MEQNNRINATEILCNKVKDWKRVMGVAYIMIIVQLCLETRLLVISCIAGLSNTVKGKKKLTLKRLFLHTIGG